MELQLESLKYQDTAIQSVIKVFDGMEKNTFDNACKQGIRFNYCNLTAMQIADNITDIVKENGIDDVTARFSDDSDLCVEMETGTGKTLVYIKTIYELYKQYGFTKFIILVPSVAIRQGTLGTFKTFEKQLENIYGFKVTAFDYDSKRLNKVINFIEEQNPQVMIMTTASIDSEDKIFNRTERENLFNNLPYVDAIARVRPIIIMDEPQQKMDSDKMIPRLKTLTHAERRERYSIKKGEREKAIFKSLDPLFKIRYSATHKVFKNLLFRLTPFESYKQGLVKKIEVLTVTEKNDEATLKIELTATQNGTGDPKAKLKVWKLKSEKFVFEETSWLKVGDNLGEKTNNPSYNNYKISHINKSLRTQQWSIKFTNGVELFEKQIAGSIENIWALQLEWLLRRHFEKSKKLLPKGIKCLSLIFIDKVANYMGEDPKIKNLFVQKYKAIYPEYHEGKTPTDQHIKALQGYYFAQTSKGEFSDDEGGQKEQKKIYELILQKKDELLTIGNPVEFIFSHTALGVGWDNPNVFNIATLNTTYSEIKKRQEIGRGLRICVNQKGQRVYDALDTDDKDRINKLTVIPNETYETFVTQYQEEIKEIYGTTSSGAVLENNHKGIVQNEITFKLNKSESITQAFKRFWNKLSKKTEYVVAFDEENIIKKSIEQLNGISISDYIAEVSSRNIEALSEQGIKDTFEGTETYKLKAKFTALDLLEELSEKTGLSYPSVFKIVTQISNLDHVVKNPPQYIHKAVSIIRNIELDEMLRGLDYHLTGESFPFDFEDFVDCVNKDGYVDTPNRGVFDKMRIDSNIEYDFAKSADNQTDVVCFIKLPKSYYIKTPIGNYEPDFGLVMKRKSLKSGDESEYYFVIETKGTNDINDKKALKQGELYKIECAIKHFNALGVEVNYVAPVKEYSSFKTHADLKITKNI